MKFTRDISRAVSIRTVSDEQIVIGNAVYRNTIALTVSEVIENWKQTPIDELTPANFVPLLERSPELIILGTGKNNVFAPKTLTFSLAKQGVGLEVMDTRAAARTFNVLAGEGRDVAAVLYL